MDQKRRELIFKVLDDRHNLLPVCYYFTQYIRCDSILAWLAENKITGKTLEHWIQIQWGGNRLMPMVKFILAKIDHEKEARPIMRDMLV